MHVAPAASPVRRAGFGCSAPRAKEPSYWIVLALAAWCVWTQCRCPAAHTSDPDQPEIKIPVYAYIEE